MLALICDIISAGPDANRPPHRALDCDEEDDLDAEDTSRAYRDGDNFATL